MYTRKRLCAYCSCFIVELLREDSSAVNNFLLEAILMRDFDHANVLSLIGVTLNQDDLPMVVLPFMAKGDLKGVLKDEKSVCYTHNI